MIRRPEAAAQGMSVLTRDRRASITYSWGNERGTEFLTETVYDGSLSSFLNGFFP